MPEHLQKHDATYYFCRKVPDDIQHLILTSTGKPHTAWVWSLGIKDLATAKPLVRRGADKTDLWIAEARQQSDGAEVTPRSSREAEEQAARFPTIAVSQQTYEARRELRVHIRQKIALSTAELSPQEAAWRDLVREREAGLAELEEAVAGQHGVNTALAQKMGKQVDDPIKIMMLFDDWAKQRGKPDTVAQYRSYAESFALYVNNVDARTLTKANVIA